MSRARGNRCGPRAGLRVLAVGAAVAVVAMPVTAEAASGTGAGQGGAGAPQPQVSTVPSPQVSTVPSPQASATPGQQSAATGVPTSGQVPASAGPAPGTSSQAGAHRQALADLARMRQGSATPAAGAEDGDGDSDGVSPDYGTGKVNALAYAPDVPAGLAAPATATVTLTDPANPADGASCPVTIQAGSPATPFGNPCAQLLSGQTYVASLSGLPPGWSVKQVQILPGGSAEPDTFEVPPCAAAPEATPDADDLPLCGSPDSEIPLSTTVVGFSITYAPVTVPDLHVTTAEDTAVVADPLAQSGLGAQGFKLSGAGQGSSGSTALVSGPDGSCHSSGCVSYTPPTGFVGSDSFPYTLQGAFGEATGTVDVTVTDTPPTAPALQLVTPEDQAVSVDLLQRATTVAGNSLQLAAVGRPAHGTLTATSTGERYTPDAGYVGADSFSYAIADNHQVSTDSVVHVRVNDVSPVLRPTSLTTREGTPVSFNALSSAATVPGNTVAVSAFGKPQHGTVTGSAGRLTYRPTAGFTGTDHFPVTVTDGKGGEATATVTVRVDPVPTQVLALHVTRPPQAATRPAVVPAAGPATAALPYTGADVTGQLGWAGGLTGAGGLLLWLAGTDRRPRRRKA